MICRISFKVFPDACDRQAWVKLLAMCGLFFILLQSAQATSLTHEKAVQRGAMFFMNYCSGCHSLRYMRPDHVTGNQSLTKISLPEADARQWFGRMPPDLSLTARQRGPVWLYAYLTGFYADKTRPFGTNNHTFPDVSMPDVLYPLRGHINLDADLHDVVSFLVYVAEPARSVRYQAGFWVILFSVVLGLLIYRLKVIYWRDIR